MKFAELPLEVVIVSSVNNFSSQKIFDSESMDPRNENIFPIPACLGYYFYPLYNTFIQFLIPFTIPSCPFKEQTIDINPVIRRINDLIFRHDLKKQSTFCIYQCSD